MRKIPFVALVVIIVTALGTAPAAAHAVFVGAPESVPANSEQALVMNVPHERDDTTYNVDIVIAMPAGWQPRSCATKPSWSCNVGVSGDRQIVHFIKAAGAEPAEDETFGFTVRAAATAGSFLFPTVQTYNTGEVVRWIDATGGAEPAPALRTTASGAVPETTGPPASVAPPTPTTPAPAPTTSRPASTTSAAPATTAPAPAVATSTTAVATTSTTTSSTSVPGSTSTTAPVLSTADAPDDDGAMPGIAIAAGIRGGARCRWAGVLLVRRRRTLPGPPA